MHFPRSNFSAQSLHQDQSVRDDRRGGDTVARPPLTHRRFGEETSQVAGRALVQQGRPLERQRAEAAGSPAHPMLEQSEEKFRDQPWQSYFFLAPNVRFTRTPEREFIRRRPAEPEQVLDTEPRQEAVRAEDIGAQENAGGETQAPLESVALPRSAYPFGSLLDQAQAAEAATMRAEGSHSHRPEWQAGAILNANPLARQALGQAQSGRALWSHLSDHAFFELMPFEGPQERDTVSSAQSPIAEAKSSANAVATRPIQIPVRQPSEITSLFKVIECRPASASASARDPEIQSQEVSTCTSEKLAETQTAAADADGPVTEAYERVQSGAQVVPFPPASLKRPGAVARKRLSVEGSYEFPSEDLLQDAPEGQGFYMTQEQIEQNAGLLESVLEDFGVRGEIIHVRPGPVVTLYEFEPAPGVKSSRVINLADDIARSMSAVSARVAVVPGRNVIGIELPNVSRETVYLRELIQSNDFHKTGYKLALCLGKTIGGEPVIAELAKMPHLLVAGTTGSGKSVAINTMILSLLYRLRPEECRLIMVDPKMLELSVYDGIPHLLTPVVTDPKKAVTALKWAVREMEDRYRKMARLGVRNIDGYNQRAAAARDKGEPVLISVQTGFDRSTGEPIFEEQEMDLAPMPYIVVIVDEMADLMMVAGKEIEGAIQRLAQMARAAGIHLIMATQRPSVDVITGTIKANFPTRISFQVTSKIDSRTILGEQGAEQLLGQGDMLHMSGGGRIVRVHGPFVSDEEVEQVVAHLKTQGRPEYLETVTADEEEEQAAEEDSAVFDKGAIASEDGNDLYDQAVKVVLRDKRCSTSYIQRRLGIGYNRAASLIERMEQEGLVGKPNHVGKRDILMGSRDTAPREQEAD